MKNDREADNMDLHDYDDVAENYDLYLGGYHKESGAASADNVIWCVQKKDSLFGNTAY
jgi:hypothetical protein